MRYKLHLDDIPGARLAAINLLDMNLSDYYYARHTSWSQKQISGLIITKMRSAPSLVSESSTPISRISYKLHVFSRSEPCYKVEQSPKHNNFFGEPDILDEDQILFINTKLESLR
jgi:hypothetical protein